VKLPGLTLPPGKYLFRVADSRDWGRVVQVLSADGKDALWHVLRDSGERRIPPPAPEVRFIEHPPVHHQPQRMVESGELIGREFIYPGRKRCSSQSLPSRPVLTTKSNTTTVEQTKNADLSRLSPNGQETNVNAKRQASGIARLAHQVESGAHHHRHRGGAAPIRMPVRVMSR